MIRRTTLVEEVYRVLRDMIASGELKPGEVLVQDQLAEKLGVSRTPLLHALRLLESENLLIRSNTHRVSVRQLTLEEAIVLFEMRESLESLACRYLTPIIAQEDIDRFRRDFTLAYEKKNVEEYRKADTAFHLFIAERCPYLDLRTVLARSGFMTKCLIKGLVRPPEETYEEHLEILRCFETRDPIGAEEAMRTHIRRTVERLKLLRDSHGALEG